MFGHRDRLRRLNRLSHLSHLGDIGGYGLPFGSGFRSGFRGRYRSPFGSTRRQAAAGPSAFKIILAGLAVFALARLMSNDGQRRSTAEKVLIGGLIAILGALLLSLRRSTARYR